MITTDVFLKEEIVKAEKELFAKGVSPLSLIDKAGKFLADEIKGKNTAIVVGTGNNGSDGLCAGQILLNCGQKVDIFKVGEISSTGEYYADKITSHGVEIKDWKDADFSRYDVIADCIFGIGLNREIIGEYADCIDKINQSGAKIVSADIPSGLNANTGKTMGVAINANKTLSFSGIKAGYLLSDGQDLTGDIVLCDTGIYPKNKCATLVSRVTFPKRKRNTHKGSYGKVYLISGSDNFVGASILAERSAHASLRSGAGLVTLCVPRSLKEVYASRITESTLKFLPDSGGKIKFSKNDLDDIILRSDVIAIGMGLGASQDVEKTVIYLLENYKKPLLLDADALNVLAGKTDILKGKENVVITPHLGEFSRLLGKEIKDIDLLQDSRDFAKNYGVTVLLKGTGQVIAYPNGETYITASGTPAMAKGGSGDVLSGVISAFLAGNVEKAVVSASFIHGEAGKIASEELCEYGVLARDIADSIPLAMKKYVEE